MAADVKELRVDLTDRERDELRDILWEYHSGETLIIDDEDDHNIRVAGMQDKRRHDFARDLYFRLSRP